MPESINLKKRAKLTVTDNDTARELLPARPLDGHKGTFGRVLLVAGSDEMPGAAGLTARAAYRTGAGLVELAAPLNTIRVLQTHLLEAVWTPLLGLRGGSEITEEHQLDNARVIERMSDAKALVIGPGMGDDKSTRSIVESLLHAAGTDYAKLPVIIDADGLNALTTLPEWKSLVPADAILTPHPGEMARLTGLSITEVQQDRLTLAGQSAAEWKAIVVLKGAHTVVAAPDGRMAISPFKTDALAKGGTGDVLSGILGALCAQGLKPFEAAVLGVYLHSLAGVIAADRAGFAAGVLASEVADAIPAALGRILAG